jgi:glycosyltransferase involved in cell wall biosynthesis
MPPRISVVIPTYNRLAYLREALDSIRVQTRPADEILVVDDGSTDATESVIGAMPPPIRYIRQKNAGPAAARNRGIREATGDWVAFLDSDDLWTPDKLAAQMDFLERNPGIDFLFAHMVNFGPHGEDAGPEILDPAVNAYCQAHATDLRDFVVQLLRVNPVPTSTVIFRRAVVERVGYLREDIGYADDFQWWLRWALATRCGFLDRVLEKRRIHDSNIIGDRRRMLISVLAVLDDLDTRRAGLSAAQQVALDAALNRERYRLGSEHYRLGDFAKALPLLRRVNPARLPSTDPLKWGAKTLLAAVRR